MVHSNKWDGTSLATPTVGSHTYYTYPYVRVYIYICIHICIYYILIIIYIYIHYYTLYIIQLYNYIGITPRAFLLSIGGCVMPLPAEWWQKVAEFPPLKDLLWVGCCSGGMLEQQATS